MHIIKPIIGPKLLYGSEFPVPFPKLEAENWKDYLYLRFFQYRILTSSLNFLPWEKVIFDTIFFSLLFVTIYGIVSSFSSR